MVTRKSFQKKKKKPVLTKAIEKLICVVKYSFAKLRSYLLKAVGSFNILIIFFFVKCVLIFTYLSGRDGCTAELKNWVIYFIFEGGQFKSVIMIVISH